jgi:predicted TIM-barrel fold metal-dependent hydrolase
MLVQLFALGDVLKMNGINDFRRTRKHFAFLIVLSIALCCALLAGCRDERRIDYPIYSVHEHLGSGANVEDLLGAMDAVGIGKMVLLGSYESLLAKKKKKDFSSAHQNNLLILRVAAEHPDRFIPFPLLDTNMGKPLERLSEYLERGAKGVKLYNGLTSYRLIPADSPVMRSLYAFCEKNQLPILIHLDIKRYPGELEHICEWYPDLIVIAPHLFCRPEWPNRLERMLDRYPNLYTDVSYGFENWVVSSFKKISKRNEELRKVIIRYKHRILFGTDVCISDLKYKDRPYMINQFMGYRNLLERKQFPFDVIMSASKTEHLDLNGLHLDSDTLKALYHDNFKRLLLEPKLEKKTTREAEATSRNREGVLVADFPASVISPPKEMKHYVRIMPGHMAKSAFDFETVLALATHFTQNLDDLQSGTLQKLLAGEIKNWSQLGGQEAKLKFIAPLSLKNLLVSAFQGLDENHFIQWIAEKEINVALTQNPDVLALLPLERLHHRYKVLTISGISPFENVARRTQSVGAFFGSDYLSDYPMKVKVSIVTDDDSDQYRVWLDQVEMDLRKLRYWPDQLKTILLTGCSLFGQGIAYDKSPPEDPLWPVKKISPYFQSVDIAHISQECPLVKDCVQEKGTWDFCSDKNYIKAFTQAGIDIVELTGNHQTDFGRKIAADTCQLYKNAGLEYFGGGMNREDARRIRYIDVRGARFAFIGYNHISGKKKLALEEKAGANKFYEDYMVADIRTAREKADFVFVHFQWGPEFAPVPRPRMIRIAQRAIDEGATVVTGTHAHRTTAMEFYKGGVIFYGLGNFMFVHPGEKWTERSLAIKYTFLKNRLMNAQPMGLALEGFQSRWLDPLENDELLNRLFANSKRNLESFPFYPAIAAGVGMANKKYAWHLDRAMHYAGVETLVTKAHFQKPPSIAECQKSNRELLQLKPKYVDFMYPIITAHPDENPTQIKENLKTGVVGVRLLLDFSDQYPPAKLAELEEVVSEKGIFIGLETIGDIADLNQSIQRFTDAFNKSPVLYYDHGELLTNPELLKGMLEKNMNLFIAIQAFPDQDLKTLAFLAESRRDEIVKLIEEYPERFVAGFGFAALGEYKRKNKEVQGLYFRALAFRNIFENSKYSFPVLSHRGSEWSYKYENEAVHKGLALTPTTLKKLYFDNMYELIY